MKKVKNTDPTPAEDQFTDFSQDDFAELDKIAAEDSADQPGITESADLDSEYHNADPDLPHHLSENSTATKKSLIEMAKENWLYISIGVVVLIIAAYLMMNVFSSSNPPAQKVSQAPVNSGFNNVPPVTNAATPTTEAPAAVPPDSQPESAAPVVTPPAVIVEGSGNVSMTDQQLQQMMQDFTTVVEKNSENLQNALAQNNNSEDSLNAIASNMNQLASNVDRLNQNLVNVQQALTATQQQLQTLLSQQTATNANLTVRAVVPGRAWLVDGSGHTTSVAVGTSLGAIGTVTQIDSTNGTVTTSTGYVFK